MNDDFFNHYIKTSDDRHLSFVTNFNLNDENHHNVLIFNYGLVCSFQHWEEQVNFFHDKGFKILLHHYRGHFLSDGVNDISEITFKRISLDIEEIVKHAKIKSIVLVGHSMGVNISLETAIHSRLNVSGLILISGTVQYVENVMFDNNIMSFVIPTLKLLKNQYPNLIEKFWRNGGHFYPVKKIIQMQGFNAKKVPLEYVEIYLNRVGKLGSEVFIQLFNEMSNHPIQPHLTKIQCPCLIIGGEKDKIVPTHQQRFLHQHIADSELYIVKDGSHVPQKDFPELVNNRMTYFFEKYRLLSTYSSHDTQSMA